MPSRLIAKRFTIVLLFFLVLFGLVIYQLIQLTVIHQKTLRSVAGTQHHLKVEIPALRGTILDRKGKELATSLKVPSIYGVPRLVGVKRKSELSRKIANILGIDTAFVLDRLQRDKSFIWLKRRVTYEEAEKIRALKDPALGILEEFKRFYPHGDMLSQTIGFADVDGRGLEGIEFAFNQELQGRHGVRVTKRDALGREIKAFEAKEIPAVDGNKIHTTIDQNLQFITERSLDEAFRQWKAKGASAVLMEAKTGKILAIANRPGYDLNAYQQSVPDSRRNRAITDMYEPGSVFKIVAASAVLNEGMADVSTEFFCENGKYKYGSRTLHDVHPYGKLSFADVIVKSSNIGTVKIAALLKPDVFQSYIEKFGFGKLTGIDLPGEVRGFTRPPSQWSKTSPYNIPMGHEILVNLVQMVRAMAVIANGGNLVTPYVIERVEDQAGVVLREKHPVVQTGVIRPEVAAVMREILVRVVNEGTGKKAIIKNIAVGGKTGTAQKVLPGGKGYSHTDFMSSFVGFAPAEDPQFVMAVLLDDPGPSYYGGTVAAPVFKEVMEAALKTSGYIAPSPEDLVLSKKMQDPQGSPPILLPARA